MPSASSLPKASPSFAGHWTGWMIFLVVTICIGLIGLSGYVKYELDHAEALLASAELQSTPEQQAFGKIRRDVGYGGFLGLAQNFVLTRDPALLEDMKKQLKQADEGLARMPDKANAETRHDLQAILAAYAIALQKAEKSIAIVAPPAPSIPEFTTIDLVPLYEALPVLDNRIASALAADRLEQQNQAQFWATCLTLISWSSLIIASALAAGIFLTLRTRNAAPMRALAQSIKNMASGDLRSPVWGMERQDAIGEVARAVDMARFHFNQLPDMSLLSEQGPIRIRFEGNTRSLFEAMMRVISKDSEQVHAQAASLTDAVQKQQEALAHVIERVEAVLHHVEKRAVTGDQTVRQALQGMLNSAESLKHAQEHAADQLNRIVPFLQERTQGISEIAQITGKQVAHALQSLALTERGLKTSAEQSDAAIQKFSATADTLGERLFGAVNLLQASGKVLAETTEAARSRFDAAIERIDTARQPTEPSAPHIEMAEKLETALAALESLQGRLETVLAEQKEAVHAQVDLLTTQSGSLLAQVSSSAQTLSTSSDHLRDEHAKLASVIDAMGTLSQNLKVPSAEPGTDIVANLKENFVSLEQRMTWIHSQIALLLQQAEMPKEQPVDFAAQMHDHWYQMAAQIEATRSNLAEIVRQQIEKVETQIANLGQGASGSPPDSQLLHDTQSQMEQQTLILNELVATLGLLDAHMQELRSQVATLKKAG